MARPPANVDFKLCRIGWTNRCRQNGWFRLADKPPAWRPVLITVQLPNAGWRIYLARGWAKGAMFNRKSAIGS